MSRLRQIQLLAAVFLIAWGAINLDWIFNTGVKAWEPMELMPKVFVLTWILYFLGVVSLTSGAILLGMIIAFLGNVVKE